MKLGSRTAVKALIASLVLGVSLVGCTTTEETKEPAPGEAVVEPTPESTEPAPSTEVAPAAETTPAPAAAPKHKKEKKKAKAHKKKKKSS